MAIGHRQIILKQQDVRYVPAMVVSIFSSCKPNPIKKVLLFHVSTKTVSINEFLLILHLRELKCVQVN